jgi:RimJ/RimL family protein N-acetyltransferase
VIGVSRHYREHWLDEGTTTVGRAVLSGALERIARESSNRLIPSIWAYVAPDNERSQRMFEREGFRYHPPIRKGGDAIVYRPPDLPF